MRRKEKKGKETTEKDKTHVTRRRKGQRAAAGMTRRVTVVSLVFGEERWYSRFDYLCVILILVDDADLWYGRGSTEGTCGGKRCICGCVEAQMRCKECCVKAVRVWCIG